MSWSPNCLKIINGSPRRVRKSDDPFQIHATLLLKALQPTNATGQHIIEQGRIVAVAMPHDLGADGQ